MDDSQISSIPGVVEAISADTHRVRFPMASDPRTGSLLRTLAASKPGGRLLELGTGTGAATAWMLSGMDAHSQLISVDNDPNVLEIARRHLGDDSRVTFRLAEGAVFLGECGDQEFDLIFADAWAGKYTHLDLTLSLLRVGGLYVIDDLLPQPSWPDEHAEKARALVRRLESRGDVCVAKLAWASGLLVATRLDAGQLGAGAARASP